MPKKKGAPGALELVREFVNTLDVETGRDRLATPGGLREWLAEHSLFRDGLAAGEPGGEGAPAGEAVTEVNVQRSRRVREAVRDLLLANAGEEVQGGAVAQLNEAAGRARLALSFRGDGSWRLEPLAGGVDGAIGRLLAAVAAAMAEGTWSRLKACREERCHWAFYDHTRNRSGVWCDMAVCGNRTKVRVYRTRRGADSSGEEE